MDKISYLINDILAMNKDQLLKFKKYMNYLDSNYNINNYYEIDYRQFSLVSYDYEEFRFYRDGDNKLSCEYIIYDEIGINNLSNLIYCFKDKDILINALTHILTNINISSLNTIKSNKMITNFPHNKDIINKQLKNDIEEELSKLLGAIVI